MKKLMFELNEKETQNFDNFFKNHECAYPDRKSARKACGVDGAVATVTITMTTIGNVVICRCNACGKEEDITDYDSV